MVLQKCSKCKKEKELNETNFKLNPLNNNYFKNCITCLEYNRNNKNNIKVCCLVCKVELCKHNFKQHCETKTHQNNLNGIKKKLKKKLKKK